MSTGVGIEVVWLYSARSKCRGDIGNKSVKEGRSGSGVEMGTAIV